MLWTTTVQDIRRRFAGTLLGMAWALCYPLAFLVLYAAMYLLVFRAKPAGMEGVDYVLFLFAGLIPFLGFSEAVSLGASSVTANRGLVKNTLFPIELIPVKAALVGSLSMIIGLMALMSTSWARGTVLASQLLLPLIVLLQLGFTIGVVWLCSSIQVFLKDLTQIVSIAMLFLMMASPIAYTLEMVPSELLPFIYLNPLHHLLVLYRGCVLTGSISPLSLVIFGTMSCGVFFMGHFVFRRFKELFPEYV
jgi:lipopolysaccharide transport system permease protein